MATAASTGSSGTTRPKVRAWFYGYTPPERGTVVLGHRRVYIVPTRAGWLFGSALALLLIGSINYALSLGFALTFLLAGVGISGMVHTVRNLAKLGVSTARIEHCYAGESAQFPIVLDGRLPIERPSILVRHPGSGAQMVIDVPAGQTATATLSVPAVRRGWLPLGRVMLETRYPLGLFRAWSYVEPDARALVYPRPEPSPLPRASADQSVGTSTALAAGNDDFSGLRDYQPSDPPRHVAWKAMARTQSMLTKQFTGEAAAELWLDWNLLPPGLGVEQRLSRLAGWVLEAERAGMRYGLRLPGTELSPENGDAHRAACLRTLALHEAT